jgi:hypothetical protein
MVAKMIDVTKPKYPEAEKYSAVREQANQIGNFIDFLRDEKKYTFAKWYNMQEDPDEEETDDKLMPEFPNMEKLLMEFFEIDENKLEAERRAMLEECRQANAQKSP